MRMTRGLIPLALLALVLLSQVASCSGLRPDASALRARAVAAGNAGAAAGPLPGPAGAGWPRGSSKRDFTIPANLTLPGLTAGFALGLDVSGSIFLNQVIWPRTGRNVTQYIAFYNTIQAGLSNPSNIIPTLSAAGLLNLVIFLLASIILFIYSLLQCIFWPCCRACGCCGGKKPFRYGYSRVSIVCTSVMVVLQLSALLYFAVAGLTYSGYLGSAMTDTAGGVYFALSSAGGYVSNATAAVGTVANTVDSSVQGFVNNITNLPINASVIQPNLQAPYSALQSALDRVGGNLTTANNSVLASISMISGVQAAKSNLTTNLNNLMNQINALSPMTIDGTNYTLSNVPAASQVDPSKIPDLSNLPSLSNISNALAGAANVSDVAASTRVLFNNITTSLPAQIQSKVQTIVPANPGSFIRSFQGGLNSSTGQIGSMLGSVNGSVAGAMVQVNQYDMIRSDVNKIYLIIFIAFCSLGLLAVLIQKRKCMFLVIPIFLIWAVLSWPQFLVYFIVGLPFNELCLSRDALLSSSINAGSFNVQPSAILNSCTNNAYVLNVTLDSANTTVFTALGQPQFAAMLTDPAQLGAQFGLDGTLTATLNASVAIAFPNTSSAVSSVSGLNFAGYNYTPFTSLPTAPYDLPTLQTSINTFTAGLTPAAINSSFTEAGMANKIASFNSAARAGNSSWVDWTFNDIVGLFVNASNTFAADTYVTGSSSNSQNSNINNAFNNAYPDVKYKQHALNAIQVTTNTANAIMDTANTLLLPLNANMSGIVGNMSAVQNSTANLAADVGTISPAATAVSNALPATISALATLVVAAINQALAVMIAAVQGQLAQGTNCKVLAQSLLGLLNVTCGETLSTLNGLWMSTWLIGTLLLTAFTTVVRASKRLGNVRKIAPLPMAEPLDDKAVAKKGGKRDKDGKGGPKIVASARV